MATYNLIVPEKNLISPTSWGNRATITRVVDNIVTKFGKFIKWSSETSNIPAEVIASFIAVESTGNPLASAGGDGHVTQGLMQWDRRFARNFLEAENRMGRLSKSEKDKLASFNIVFDANGKTRDITNADQKNAELNIVIGTILLGQYADSYFDGGKKDGVWGTDENGNLRMDRIIAVYNAGAYGETGQLARQKTAIKSPSTGKVVKNIPKPLSSIIELSQGVNPTTRSYIAKMLGINGAMDVSTSELASKFQNL